MYLCLLLFCGINNRCAAHFSNLAALAIEGPTTDLITNYVFDEEHPAIESQGQLVKELNVFQHVVVRIAVRNRRMIKSTTISPHRNQRNLSVCCQLNTTHLVYEYLLLLLLYRSLTVGFKKNKKLKQA